MKNKNLLEKSNKMKDELMNIINAYIFKIERNDYLGSFTTDCIKDVVNNLRKASSNLDNAIFSGDEEITSIYNQALAKLNEFANLLNGDSNYALQEGAKQILKHCETINQVANEELIIPTNVGNNLPQNDGFFLARKRKRVATKLEELNQVRNEILKFEKKLENDIILQEKTKAELEDKMITEENERILNEIDRRLTSVESIIASLDVNKSNYSACFTLLNNIYERLRPLVVNDTLLANDNLDRVDALLKIADLKNVLSTPKSALKILSIMNGDSEKILMNIDQIDSKINDAIAGNANTKISESALNRRNELLRKKRERELNKENLSDLKVEKEKEKENV